MPTQPNQQVNIAALLGPAANRAWEESKDLPNITKSDGLPGGIDNGIAQLTKLYFGVYENGQYKGKPYFAGTAVVQMPITFTDAKGQVYQTKGMHTRIMEVMADTSTASGDRKTLTQHYLYMKSVLENLGVKDPK